MSIPRTTALAFVVLVSGFGVASTALADRDGYRGGPHPGYRGGPPGGYRGGPPGGYPAHRGYRHHDHDDHWSGSVVIGVPLFAGPSYGYGYYGYPYPYRYRYGYPGDVVVIRERSETPALPSGPPPQQYWYYCDSARGYYPYVSSCPEQWRAVPATPPASP